MTLQGICGLLSYHRDNARNYLEAGNPERAKGYIRGLKAYKEKYFSTKLSEEDLELERRIKIALRNNPNTLNGPFNHKVLAQEWLEANYSCNQYKHCGFSLHANKSEMLKYNDEYSEWEIVRENSKKIIGVNSGTFNLVEYNEDYDYGLFIEKDGDFKSLYNLILKKYGKICKPIKG